MVYDVNALVGAAIGGNSPYRSWPSPPPVSGNAYADCIGIANDAAEFALWLSPHLLGTAGYVLQNTFKWEAAQVEALLTVLVELAEDGGVAWWTRHVPSSTAPTRKTTWSST